jgi:acetylornithine deacetylase/succinyl-diaminopimelate desuccinylase-like protein
MNWNQHTQETTELLQALLRFNTTNPPGNETPCIHFIAETLKREGIESVVLESAPGRGNLVARIKGDGSMAPMMLFGHVDVVPAEADKWQRDPFSGDLVDGIIWGRGATDMKHMVTMNLMTFMLLKRQNMTLKRDIIFMANADEEVGGIFGAKWMVDNHPDLIKAEYALTEGGATSIELEGKSFFVCCTGEKGAARFKVRGRGKPGHASQPHSDNAILPLAIALQKIIETPLPHRVIPTTRAFIESLAANVNPGLAEMLRGVLDPALHDDAVAELPLAEPIKRRINAMYRDTATPTILRAGTKINVIPATAEAEIDCRVLPGTTPESIARDVKALLGDSVEIEFGRFSPGIENDPESPLLNTIKQSISDNTGGGIVVPGLITGGTDARHFSKTGTKVYGFIPTRYEGASMMGLAHAHDERISVNNLMFGTQMIYDITKQFCA